MTYMNDSIDWIGAKEDSMRKYEEEYKKMKDKKIPETDLIIDRISRSR